MFVGERRGKTGSEGVGQSLSKFWLLVVVILALGSVSPLFSGLRPALKLGVLRADLFGRDTYEQGWKTGFAAGLTAEIKIRKKFGLETGIFFGQEGSIYRLPEEETGYRETVTVTLVHLPVLTRFYVLSTGSCSFYLAGGPDISMGLKARLEVVSAGEKNSVVLDNLKGSAVSLNLAAGVEYRAGPGLLLMELVLRRGLDSISREPDEDVRLQSLSLLVGFRL